MIKQILIVLGEKSKLTLKLENVEYNDPKKTKILKECSFYAAEEKMVIWVKRYRNRKERVPSVEYYQLQITVVCNCL